MRTEFYRLTLSGVLAITLFGFSSLATAQETATPDANAVAKKGMCKMMDSAKSDSGSTAMGMKGMGQGGKMQGCKMMGSAMADSGATQMGMKGMNHGGGQGMKRMGQGGGQGMKGMGQGGGQGMKGMGQGGGQGMKGMGQGGGQGMKGMNHGGGQGMKGMGMMMAIDSTVLEQDVIDAIGVALQDEFKSEALYQRVLNDHGASTLPFANIVNAERRHSAHLIDLLNGHGAPVPESVWTPEKSPSYKTVTEACKASVQAEIDNVAVYDGLYNINLPDDVKSMFEHLQMISQERHLPAFKRCAGN